LCVFIGWSHGCVFPKVSGILGFSILYYRFICLTRVKFKAKAIGLLYEIENYGRLYSSSDPSFTPSSLFSDDRRDVSGGGEMNESTDCTPHNRPSLVNEILSSSDFSTPTSTVVDVVSVADNNNNGSSRKIPIPVLQHSGSNSTISSASGPATSASTSRKRSQQPHGGIRPTVLSPHYASGYLYSSFSSKSNGNNAPPFIFPPGECDDQPLSEEMQKHHDIAILLSLESPLVTCRSNSSKHRSRKDDFSCRRYSLPIKLSSSTKTLLASSSAGLNLSAVSSPSDSYRTPSLPPLPPPQANATSSSPLPSKKESSELPVFILPSDNNNYIDNGNSMKKPINFCDLPSSSIKTAASTENLILPAAAEGDESTFEHDENHPEQQQLPQHQPKSSPPRVSQDSSSSNHPPLSTLSH
jgi:hypothetical protein